ncbi:MAG: Gfo/Idh/MocA family oxidoreductase [Puniceicoccales bacterium]|jgi:predicted dehydrogenase|nr:Gfo/Idh/MocA family oxidoreductase [Puniceicoccales bacterium]
MSLATLNRPLNMGIVGGGSDSFIGKVHRIAAQLDGKIKLVAGALSIDPKIALQSGKDLFLSENRTYLNYQDMVAKEASLPAGERIDFVAVVTPDDTHVPISLAFLEAGINVMCEKPVAVTLEDAHRLRDTVRKTGRIFGIMHGYTGYPLVRHARAIVRSGKIGQVYKIIAEYPQDWILPHGDDKPQIAGWRMDPKYGKSLSMGDIGIHAAHLARFITGLEIDTLNADLQTYTPGGRRDDDGNVLVRYKAQGDAPAAHGIIYASQVSAGEENALTIRIYGSKGGIEWHQENPNQLILKTKAEPTQILTRAQPYLDKLAGGLNGRNQRIPTGHPEGFIEAFANIYLDFADDVAALAQGQKPAAEPIYPDIDDAVFGKTFVEYATRSNESGEKWLKFPEI